MTINDSNSIRSLLSAEISWVKVVGSPGWQGRYRGAKCELTMGDFPEEPLYKLVWRSQRVEFDDTPETWKFPRY